SRRDVAVSILGDIERNGHGATSRRLRTCYRRHFSRRPQRGGESLSAGTRRRVGRIAAAAGRHRRKRWHEREHVYVLHRFSSCDRIRSLKEFPTQIETEI